MVIGGFQKLSFLDYPGIISTTVFTQGCMFRCPYCHNPELVEWKNTGAISEDKVVEYLEEKKYFLEGVTITGGEPTLHGDLGAFIARIKSLGLLVKLDTTGIRPEVVDLLIRNKLVDYIAMDIKHTWDNYQKIVKTASEESICNCRKTFHIIQSSDVAHEFRTTVYPELHEEKDFFEIAGYLQKGENYFIQQISYKKNLDHLIKKDKKIDTKKLVEYLRISYPHLHINERS